MTYSRRDFLKSMVGASSFLSLAPTFPAFLQQRGGRGRVKRCERRDRVGGAAVVGRQ